MARRDRPRRIARRQPYLEPRRRLLVVCEGKVTEREYLTGFRRWCQNPRVEIQLVAPAGVPITLVTEARDRKADAEDEAKRQRDENVSYDEVWCVFDVDEHPRIAEARKMARDHGLHLAMSNACFELWLLLHLRENPGPQHRHDLQKMLAELMPGVGEKHIDFDKLIVGYDEAFRRAERLESDALQAGEEGRDPTTEMFHLTDSIDETGGQRRLAQSRRPDGQLVKQEESRAKAKAAADAALEQAANEEAAGGGGDQH